MTRSEGSQPPRPLADHVRQGRRFLPKLAATGVLNMGDWIRDDLPDLIWPALLLAYSGTGAARNFVRWQAAVQRDLAGDVDVAAVAEGLDGRLTSLDRLVGLRPDAQGSLKRWATKFGLLPGPVAAAMATYPERPAMWLVDDAVHPPTQEDIDLLAEAALGATRDGHREAIIKCLGIWSAVQAGTFRGDTLTIGLLQRYPNDQESQAQADSVVRAAWGAAKASLIYADPTHFDESVKWAKTFWGTNSMTSRCLRRRDAEVAEEEEAEVPTWTPTLDHPPDDGDNLQQFAMDLVASYVQSLETSPARLYDPERQEVHAGLVTRVGREIITVLGCRDLWSVEHGSHVNRVIVEARILLQWMATQAPEIYRRFQDFGSGKAKLYARILDETPEDARMPGFDEAIQELDRLSHNDDVIDYRVVDTSDSFAGKSIRAMAEESGLLELYRHAYYISSGVTHSEWWSLENHAMERCLNVLHRFHLIPSLTIGAGGNVPLATSWVGQLYSLIRISLDLLGTDRAAVTEAFSWLESESVGSDST